MDTQSPFATRTLTWPQHSFRAPSIDVGQFDSGVQPEPWELASCWDRASLERRGRHRAESAHPVRMGDSIEYGTHELQVVRNMSTNSMMPKQLGGGSGPAMNCG